MSPFLSLLKIQFKMIFSFAEFKSKYLLKKKRLVQPVLFAALMGLAIIPFEAGLVAFFNQFFTLLNTTGQEAVLITTTVLTGQLIVLMFGLFYLMSAFYFSGDLKQLLPLPLRPQDIIGAKLAVVIVSDYLTLLPLVAPAFIVFGIRSDAAWWYWPVALTVFLLLPVLPLAFSTFLIIPLMRFTALLRNRDMFRVAGSLLAVMIFMLIQFTINRSGQGMDEQQMQQLLSTGKTLSATVGAVFPPAQWATAAMALHSFPAALKNLLMFAVASVVFLFPALFMAGKWFFVGVTGGSEVRKANRQSKAARAGAFRRRSPFAAALWREIKLFLRTPVFILNGLFGYIMVPVLILMGLQNEAMGEVLTGDPKTRLIIILIVAGVIILNNALSPVAATSVSREGRMFWISKHLPMTAGAQVAAKLCLAMLISAAGALLITSVIYIAFKLPAMDLFLIFILGAAGSLPFAGVGLIVDLLRPNLDWTDPQRAIKGFNGFLAFLASLPVFGVMGLAGAAMIYYGLLPSLVYLFLLAVFLLLGLLLYLVVIRLAEKRYFELMG
ncbi:MAG: hypothetical protein PHS52_06095 [Desulfotomaculaceae bacterium]|nr:hypothetical protein [Desulfotomaculaceae bacterium]